MSRNNNLPAAFWVDHDDLPPDGKALAIWANAGDLVSLSGAFKCRPRDLGGGGFTSAQLDRLLPELEGRGLLVYDPDEKVAWAPKRGEWMNNPNPKVARAIAGELYALRSARLYPRVVQAWAGHGWLKEHLANELEQARESSQASKERSTRSRAESRADLLLMVIADLDRAAAGGSSEDLEELPNL